MGLEISIIFENEYRMKGVNVFQILYGQRLKRNFQQINKELAIEMSKYYETIDKKLKFANFDNNYKMRKL